MNCIFCDGRARLRLSTNWTKGAQWWNGKSVDMKIPVIVRECDRCGDGWLPSIMSRWVELVTITAYLLQPRKWRTRDYAEGRALIRMFHVQDSDPCAFEENLAWVNDNGIDKI